MKKFTLLTLMLMLALTLCVEAASAQRRSGQKKLRTEDEDDALKRVPLSGNKPTSTSLGSEDGSGDYDDDYEYDDEDDSESSGAKPKTVNKATAENVEDEDDDSLEKSVDVEQKELDVDPDTDSDEIDDTPTTTTSTTVKDDLHFVEDDDAEVQIEQEKTKVRKVSADKASKKDDLLYEYYNEYFDEDYDDLGDNVEADNVDSKKKIVTSVVSGQPPIGVTTTSTSVDDEIDSTETEKSAIFPPSYIFLIIASALVSFTIFMLAFLVCRRTVAQRRQKKMMPFVVSSSTYGPPSLSTGVKSSGPIVKNYQRVPTSTKEFLYQQQQQQLSVTETKEPLLT